MGLAKYYEDNLELISERCRNGEYRAIPYTRAVYYPAPKIHTPRVTVRDKESSSSRRSTSYYAREAAKRGISYGQLVSMINSGQKLPPIIKEN